MRSKTILLYLSLLVAFTFVFLLMWQRPLSTTVRAIDNTRPVYQTLVKLQYIQQIDTGHYHTCALIGANMGNGGIKCWGDNRFGQLGVTSPLSSSLPVDVSTLTSGVKFVATGRQHTCAVTTSGGVKCWGDNGFGQLGDGSLVHRTTPVSVSDITSGTLTVATGDEHTCVLLTGGNVKCWGDNQYGQLGNNSVPFNTTTPISVIGLDSGVKAITAGGSHTCALLDSGNVRCWGYNNRGQVGNGTTINQVTPVTVTGTSGPISAVSGGNSHTCVLKLSSGVECWGYNSVGQLGTGSTTPLSRTIPGPVPILMGGINFVDAGAGYTCAITTNATLMCWGGNGQGQLGIGSTANQYVPVEVTSVTSVNAVAAGDGSHTCALIDGGVAQCWGLNNYGQLGDSTTTDRTGPVDVLTDNQLTPAPTIQTATPIVTATPTLTPTFTLTPTQTPTSTPSLPPSGSGDTYENDDTCATARAITSDGSLQIHTFHKPGDEDWLRFDATVNKSYRIDVTIPDGSIADVDLAIYNSCESVPAEQWTASFTPGVRLTFTATVTGAIYLRLSNYDATVAGANAKYEVSVRQLTAETANRALIIVAGRLRGADRLQSNIHNVTQRVYTLFQRNDYTDDNIYYLATDSRLAGYDAAANKANLKAAITQWAKDKLPANGVLTLYMIDHGSPELFYLDEVSGQRLTPGDLNDWLTQLEDSVSGLKINVIIEACESGSFIDLPGSVSKTGRILVTSTNADYDAKASKDGAYFSDHLLTSLHQGYNLSASFLEASIVAKRLFALQTAWLDANGNGIPNEFEDAALAAQRSFAYEGTLGGDDWPPYIFSVEGPQAITNASGQISADVRDNLKVRAVWAVVYPPDYTPPAAQEELQAESLPTILLSATNNGDFYAGTYPGFTQNGVYRIVIQAEDNDGLVARPVEIEVTVGSKVFLPLVMR